MKKLFLLFLALPAILQAQTNPSKQQLRYLYDAGKLWGNVKYFHPWLQYKSFNWDAAFVAAVPQILNCQSAKEYVAVLQNMLRVLGDAATYASLVNEGKPATSIKFINTEKGRSYIQDGVLIMRLNDKAIADDYNETVDVTSSASNLLDSVHSVVFDLRQTTKASRLADPSEINYEFSTGNRNYKSLNEKLFSASQQLPAERYVMHVGFKPEGPGGADYVYQSFFKISQSTVVNGSREKSLQIVFLVNKNVALPAVAIVLQKLGKAIILSEDANVDAGAAACINYTVDSVEINLRKSELVDEDGLLLVKEDSLLRPEMDYDVNLQTAIALVTKPFKQYKNNSVAKTKYTGVWKADTYTSGLYPDLGYRVLAAAKMYNVIRFFDPDKDLFDNNWDSVFFKYLPQFITAKDSLQYMKAVTGMYSNMQDSHGFVNTALDYAWADIFGESIPFCFRISRVEDKAVVTYISNDSAAKKEGFALGDVILSIGGKSPDAIVKEAAQYFPTSNNETKYRDISNMVVRGNDNATENVVVLKPDGRKVTIPALHSKKYFYSQKASGPPSRTKKPIYSITRDNIGYIDMVQLDIDNVDSVMNLLRNTKAIILDDRAYPADAAQQLFRYLPLPKKDTTALSVIVADADVIGNEYRDYSLETVQQYKNKFNDKDRKWLYTGKLVVLFNEWTQSQAEGTAKHLMLCGAVAVGSHTAGANGDITNFNLPGNVNLSFSGARVSMQRTGILPDIKVLPTIKGIIAGKDEVLERAIRYLQDGR